MPLLSGITPTHSRVNKPPLIACSPNDAFICVIGWRLNPNGGYTNAGEPCFVVYNK
jgi:hypothetical protein